MSGCALIEYNNRTARIRGEVAQGDKHYIQYALAHWAVIAIRIRNTDHHFTRLPVDEWIEGIAKQVNPFEVGIARCFRLSRNLIAVLKVQHQFEKLIPCCFQRYFLTLKRTDVLCSLVDLS